MLYPGFVVSCSWGIGPLRGKSRDPGRAPRWAEALVEAGLISVGVW